MIPTRLERVASIVGASPGANLGPSPEITSICTDSRVAVPGCLFVALRGRHTDGHEHLREAFANGAVAAMVDRPLGPEVTDLGRQSVLRVTSTLIALQQLAACYRSEHLGRVIAITGSNGKTIVKDLLTSLLHRERLLATPGSFNSQLGLPLAVLSGDHDVDIAILEVGVSQPGEMAALAEICAPQFGILTNVGYAHFAAFGSRESIAKEKFKLFANILEPNWVLLPQADFAILRDCPTAARVIYVGSPNAPIYIVSAEGTRHGQSITLATDSGSQGTARINSHSTHVASNILTAVTAAHLLGTPFDQIVDILDGYTPPTTRMQVYTSPDNVKIIDDTYSSDPLSVGEALRTTEAQASLQGRRIFAFAGMRELGPVSASAHMQAGKAAAHSGITHLVVVGNHDLARTKEGYLTAKPDGIVLYSPDAAQLPATLRPYLVPGSTALLKGPRHSGMAQAAQAIASTMSQRCLWIEMGAVEENIARIRRHCGPGVAVMAMLKALAYGTELIQLASWMSLLGIRHIGVSSAGEGVAVRRLGADQDIYVFLSAATDLDSMIENRLTPIVFSREYAMDLLSIYGDRDEELNVHLKVNTGMNRLGVRPSEALELARSLESNPRIHVTGLCTHFAAAEDPSMDDFTLAQISAFHDVVENFRNAGYTSLTAHAAASAGMIRFPSSHFGMVRVGLALYGIHPSPATSHALELELAIAVTSHIASIELREPGDVIGYGGSYVVDRLLRIGIVPFGHHDGIPRTASGRGYVLVDGQRAPILGVVSMDQIFVDLTAAPEAITGSEVLIYGAHNGVELRPEHFAEVSDTIPHELLARLGRRAHKILVGP